MESDGNKAGIAQSVGSRTAAVATAEIAGHAFEAKNQDGVAITATKTITVAIAVAIVIAVAIAILRTILLRSGERPQCDHQQNRDSFRHVAPAAV